MQVEAVRAITYRRSSDTVVVEIYQTFISV